MAAAPRYRRRPGKGQPFTVPLNQPTGPKPGPEVLPWYWHPGRDGVRQPPEAFAKQLKEMAPDVRVVFSPVHERWLVWAQNPRIQHPMCRGWQLLMLWEHPVDHTFLPLNEMLFHNLVMIRVTSHPSAVAYYEKIQARIEEAKANRAKREANDREAMQGEFRDGMKISSAGRGNKFALHHDGTTVPTKAELAWRAETRKSRLPSALIQQEKNDREREEYGT